MCLTFIKYNVSTQVYTAPGDVRLDDWCNGVLIHNTGTINLLANGDLILPGASKTIGGNLGEIFTGPLTIIYQPQTPAPATVINQVTITQKWYKPFDKNFATR